MYKKSGKQDAGVHVLTLPVHNWTAGTYYVRLAHEDNIAVVKLIVN